MGNHFENICVGKCVGGQPRAKLSHTSKDAQENFSSFDVYAVIGSISFIFKPLSEENISQRNEIYKNYYFSALILVDKNDKIIGKISKLEAHILQNGQSPLHRAFSLFHFNSKNQLLLQKRSQYKITFPSLWTNTGKLQYIPNRHVDRG